MEDQIRGAKYCLSVSTAVSQKYCYDYIEALVIIFILLLFVLFNPFLNTLTNYPSVDDHPSIRYTLPLPLLPFFLNPPPPPPFLKAQRPPYPTSICPP